MCTAAKLAAISADASPRSVVHDDISLAQPSLTMQRMLLDEIGAIVNGDDRRIIRPREPGVVTRIATAV